MLVRKPKKEKKQTKNSTPVLLGFLLVICMCIGIVQAGDDREGAATATPETNLQNLSISGSVVIITYSPTAAQTAMQIRVPTWTPVPSTALLSLPTKMPANTQSEIVPAPTETNVHTVMLSNTPRPTSTEEPIAFIPGLMPADVTANLEQRGFACGTVEQGQLYYVRTCTRDTTNSALRVDIYGREAFSIDLIESSVLQFSNPDIEFASSFLGFMATMPYDGAVQEEARTWVETTLPILTGQGDVGEEVFAGVKYRLYGIPTAFTLEMGDLP